ncbi:LysR family transcriptional regulator [Ruegeria sp. 2205SS24-7]|uniref:LysR family transcriptional regulator n=1 Tax=Ruegeria discodermiae TaxID=3064389 RepID=UPI0027409044|nr:LysR family transcriptional regulator [Ruegeria sp. 2205SS24-7]MDP5220785.1 LysR family transcriptional regulator [Ruegeria sp. 2205SS24-7]
MFPDQAWGHPLCSQLCEGPNAKFNRIYFVLKLRFIDLMQMSAFETLVAIAQHSSFSRTADIRNMTLSAVSMQMKSLEEELGATLFDRRYRPPKLTPLGVRVAQDAKTIVDAYSVLKSRCMPTDQLTGTYRIGLVPSAAARILPLFLRNSAQLAPKAMLNTSTGLSENLCEQVRNGQLDAAIVTEIADATFDLSCETLIREEMVIAAPILSEAGGLSELSMTHPFLHFIPSSGIGKLIAQYRDQMQLKSKEVIILDSIEAIVNCIKSGIGYALLPKADVLRYGADQVLVLPCKPQPLFRNISLVTREDALTEIWRPKLKTLLKASISDLENAKN